MRDTTFKVDRFKQLSDVKMGNVFEHEGRRMVRIDPRNAGNSSWLPSAMVAEDGLLLRISLDTMVIERDDIVLAHINSVKGYEDA